MVNDGGDIGNGGSNILDYLYIGGGFEGGDGGCSDSVGNYGGNVGSGCNICCESS